MDKDEAALWTEWRNSQSRDSFHVLLEHYHDWLVKLAERFYFKYYLSCYEMGDYLHWGMVGLMESINRYQPVEGAQFQTYAFKRIRGEVINQINRATEELAQRKDLKMQMERIDSIVEASKSTDRFTQLYELTVGIMVGHLLEIEVEKQSQDNNLVDEIYNKQLSINLFKLLEKLPKQERDILTYHYIYSFKFTEVADIVQLTKGRVSQLHASGLVRIREMLDNKEFEMIS